MDLVAAYVVHINEHEQTEWQTHGEIHHKSRYSTNEGQIFWGENSPGISHIFACLVYNKFTIIYSDLLKDVCRENSFGRYNVTPQSKEKTCSQSNTMKIIFPSGTKDGHTYFLLQNIKVLITELISCNTHTQTHTHTKNAATLTTTITMSDKQSFSEPGVSCNLPAFIKLRQVNSLACKNKISRPFRILDNKVRWNIIYKQLIKFLEQWRTLILEAVRYRFYTYHNTQHIYRDV